MMIRCMFVALWFMLFTAFALRAADFTGRWQGPAVLADGTEFTVVFTFKQSDGKLTGLVETSEFGTFTANDLVVAGDRITFSISTDGGIYTTTGTLKPDGLFVESTGPDGPLAPVLYRRPAADLVGKWRGKVQTPDGPADIVYTFETRDGQPTGNVSGPMGVVPLINIKLDGNRITFESDYSGFVVKRRGTIAGDTMQLIITIDGNELSATFTREPAAKP